jgi:uncharacterized membrane protein
MSTLGIILVLLSAVTHASWNIVTKKDGTDPIAYLVRALFWSTLLYLPFFLYLQFQIAYTPVYTLCLALSALCSGLYFYTLAMAYQKAPVSVVYPIARTFPILVVTWAGIFLRERPSAWGVAGILIIVLGCFVLPLPSLKPGSGLSLSLYFNAGTLWALLSALFTSIYSMSDKMAARTYSALSMKQGIFLSVNYVYLQNAVSLLIMLGIMRFRKMALLPAPRKYTLPSGLIFMISYLLVMLAMRIEPVAYVVSLRQVSIVIAAAASMVWVEKVFSWPRFLGSVLIFLGACAVSLLG